MLHGCISALVTPMLTDGEIDFISLTKLFEFQIKSGISAVVVNGSTAEAAMLSDNEKIKILKYIIELNQGRIKIIAGSGTAATNCTLEFIEQINALSGIDYLMCVTPYYVKPTQEGLYAHFAQVAQKSKYPVILYNVPGRTSCNLANDTVLRLARDFSNIVGIKDATADISNCLYLLANKPANFLMFSGDDFSSLAFMLCGGNGVISAVSNVRPALFVQMTTAALAGDRITALNFAKELLPICNVLFCETNPIAIKWALFYENIIKTPHLRLPLTELTANGQMQVKQFLN